MKVVGIGTSAGGTEALEFLIPQLPIEMPPIVIVHHMEEFYIESFANRLNQMSSLEVVKAYDQMILKPGTIAVSPGHIHSTVAFIEQSFVIRLIDSPPVQFQKPSIDVLLESLAESAGSQAIAVILTGAGRDGVDGMISVKKAGGRTIAQDHQSAVDGMPKAARDSGFVDVVASLQMMPAAIFAATRRN